MRNSASHLTHSVHVEERRRPGGCWMRRKKLSPHRDMIAARHFLQLALCRTKPIRPRVINVDGHPAYARAIAELNGSGEPSRRCRRRSSPYLHNILGQDHRLVKKRIAASLWFRSIDGLNTIEEYEVD